MKAFAYRVIQGDRELTERLALAQEHGWNLYQVNYGERYVNRVFVFAADERDAVYEAIDTERDATDDNVLDVIDHGPV